MTKRSLAAVLWLLMGLSSGLLFSREHPGKGHGNKRSAGDGIRRVLPATEPVFTSEERVLISGWCRDSRGLPPGLAKRDRLPPGLQKQLYRRGTLPPGLQKKIQPVPVVWERQLRVLPTGYRRVIIGGNIILMNERTATIYDLVRIAIP